MTVLAGSAHRDLTRNALVGRAAQHLLHQEIVHGSVVGAPSNDRTTDHSATLKGIQLLKRGCVEIDERRVRRVLRVRDSVSCETAHNNGAAGQLNTRRGAGEREGVAEKHEREKARAPLQRVLAATFKSLSVHGFNGL